MFKIKIMHFHFFYSPFRYHVKNHAFLTWLFFYAIMEDN